MFVEVAVPVPLAQAFTYALPARLAGVVAGSRVMVPFGARRVLGVVLALRALPPPGVQPKEVLDLVDGEPVVPEELLSFLVELAGYYLAPIGAVLQLALPALGRADADRLAPLLGAGDPGAVGKLVRWLRPTLAAPGPDGGGPRPRAVSPPSGALATAAPSGDDAIAAEAPDPEASSRRLDPSLTPARAKVLAFVRAHGELTQAALLRAMPSAGPHLRRLIDDGLIDVQIRERPRDPFFREAVARAPSPAPTAEQALALDAITAALDAHDRRAFLLYGVTGSGKTEVYLRAISRALELGRGAMVLVPEIALTPQLVARYRERFGDEVAVMHSALSPLDRRAMWRSLREGRVKTVIGARSALFAPVAGLGLVIVDEEHEPSFKQEDGVRYHARDMALLRAHRAGAVCILGSATPSLEAHELGRTGTLTVLRLRERANEAALLPTVDIVDLRATRAGPSGDPRLSVPLHRMLDGVLAKREQAILFLNRRGFAPAILCKACGHIAQCPRCAVALTFHRRHQGIMVCHHCDHEEPFRGRCARCQGEELELGGIGTERLEETVAGAFPGARIGRLDRDTGGGAKAEAVLARLRSGETDVLIGTQMVAKGHDVPNVTLVGVIDADGALSMPDFRAAERTFQLLVQVAGRAGRGERPGTVVLQTRNPEHPAIRLSKRHDTDAFVEIERAARAELGYPPFVRLCLVRVDGEDEGVTRRAALELARRVEASGPVGAGDVGVLGPAPAPIAKLKNRHRFHLLLKSKRRPALRAVALAVLAARRDLPRGVRVAVDMDPVSML